MQNRLRSSSDRVPSATALPQLVRVGTTSAWISASSSAMNSSTGNAVAARRPARRNSRTSLNSPTSAASGVTRSRNLTRASGTPDRYADQGYGSVPAHEVTSHERRSRAARRPPGPPRRPTRPSTRSPPRSSAVGMETVCFEMATYVSRTATTPILNQSQRAQRHDPRRPGPPRRAVGRHPAVHAHVDAAGALRARLPRRRRVPRGRRVRGQRPVPRRRPPPRLQRVRARASPTTRSPASGGWC